MTTKNVHDFLQARRKWVKGQAKIKSPQVKLTQALVKGLPIESFDYEVRDTKQLGLRCRVRKTGLKNFVVMKRPKGGGKTVRTTLCNYGDLPIIATGKDDDVRKRAHKALTSYLDGINPTSHRRIKEKQEITLVEALDWYLNDIKLKASTAKGYKNLIYKHLESWLSLPLSKINLKIVKAKHRVISKDTPIAANNVMRVFRAIYNYARDELSDEQGNSPLPDCPTRSLKRKWNSENKRQGQIEPTDLKAWFNAVLALPKTLIGAGGDGELACDYLQFVLLTGLRRREATGLIWDNINLKAGVFEITDTKNNKPLKLPLSDYLLTILERRYKATQGKDKPFAIEETRRFVNRVRQESGLHFTVHDLRRSFVGYCSDCDLGIYTIKALVNHSSGSIGEDITSRYLVVNHRRLQEPMQRVTDYVLNHAGLKPTNVIKIREIS